MSGEAVAYQAPVTALPQAELLLPGAVLGCCWGPEPVGEDSVAGPPLATPTSIFSFPGLWGSRVQAPLPHAPPLEPGEFVSLLKCLLYIFLNS
jgi:hypothetical protein